jgi:hypothetical protein
MVKVSDYILRGAICLLLAFVLWFFVQKRSISVEFLSRCREFASGLRFLGIQIRKIIKTVDMLL